MVQREIEKSIIGINAEIHKTEQAIIEKEKSISSSRTPRNLCETYINLQNDLQTATNKKRKQVEKDIRNIEDEYKYIKTDSSKLESYLELKNKITTLNADTAYTNTYIKVQSDHISDIMCEKGFIIRNHDDT